MVGQVNEGFDDSDSCTCNSDNSKGVASNHELGDMDSDIESITSKTSIRRTDDVSTSQVSIDVRWEDEENIEGIRIEHEKEKYAEWFIRYAMFLRYITNFWSVEL